jgi:DNA-binding XRE family transcriptional regulator
LVNAWSKGHFPVSCYQLLANDASAFCIGKARLVLTPIQIKMARTALGWTRAQLAATSGVAAKTIQRVENGENATVQKMQKIEDAFRRAGCDFADDNWVKAPST